MMMTFETWAERTKAEGGDPSLVPRILRWQPQYVVELSYELTSIQFISWRPSVLNGRHSKLALAANLYFFEDDDDAMLFFLTWRDQPAPEGEDQA